ncbi:MAG: DUF1028 domain-containing protein [Verrucomicrobiales bacterium]
MKTIFSSLVLATLVLAARAADEPPVATFSIVAVDPETGEVGVAVQSKFLAVGSVVPWAKAGVGAVATQAWANTSYGPEGLRLLEAGESAEAAIEKMTTADGRKESRQVAVISADGKAANFTGADCLEWAGGIIGKNFSVQGNILEGRAVVEAMAESFRSSAGKSPLSERLIDALRAGQEAGGDKRGRQSAALLVVRDGWGYGGQSDRFRDLRVDDHKTPVEELQRLYDLHRKIVQRPRTKKDEE